MLFEKVVAFTVIYDIHTGFHGGTALLPLNLAASFHFDLAINNFGIQEYMLHQAFMHEVFTPNLRLEHGFLLMDDTPGIGETFGEENAKQAPYQTAYLPENHKRDSTMLYW